jgi:hypothetical protein
MKQFLLRVNEEAKAEAERRRDEALEPFLTKAAFDDAKEVNPWCVIDRVHLCYLVPDPGSARKSWQEYRNQLYEPFTKALRGVDNSAAEAIVLTFGRKMLAWMREYNREKAHKHRRHYA